MISLSTLAVRLISGTVRTSASAIMAVCLLGTVACGGSDSDDANGGAGDSDDLTGTFTFAGVTLDCETSDQDFPATGEYSVVCDNDDDDANYRFVQVTFKDEPSARVARDLKFIAPFAFGPEDHEEADTIAVSYTNDDGTLDSDDDSTGSAKVTVSGNHHVITLKDVSLSTVTSGDTGTVSAVINF
jgi:major membrane immunogen (membrane-anchored lipoprotein)